MGLLTGALSSYDVGWAGSTASDGSRAGNRENVADVLVQLTPEEHATISAIGSDTADALYWEWQTDRLSARTTAGALEGQVSTATSGTIPKTLSNNVQHFQGDFAVSNDQIEMSKRGKNIGIKDAFRYKAGQRATEKLLDVNSRAWSLGTSAGTEDGMAAGSTTAGPRSANFHYWARKTASTATGEAGTSSFLGATPATQFKYTSGTWSSADVNAVSKAMWANGVVPDTMFMNQAVKIAMDTALFASNTTASVIRNTDALQGGEYGAVVDVYRNTLGRYVVIVDRLIPTVSSTNGTAGERIFADGAWYMAKRGDMSLAWWRQFQPYNVASVGDAVQGYVRGSLGYKVKNPYAIGGVYGCTDN